VKSGWQTRTLGEVCQIKPPKSEARNRLSTDGLVSFLPMEDMGIDEKYVRATQTKPLSAVVGSYTYFAEGDVLLAKITPCFENGKLGIAEGLANGIGFGSSEYIVFRPDGMLSKEWLYYYLSRESFRVEGAARMSGAVGHKRVSKEFIEGYPIPLPPLPEQHRIVGILDEAFEGIATAKANAEKNLQNARALFESHLQSVFTQRGEGWVEKTIKEITSLLGDGLHGTPKYTNGGEYYFINGNNLDDGKIVFKENTKRVSVAEYQKHKKKLTDRTVLVSINGTLGNVAFYNNEKIILGKSACYFNLLDSIDKHFIKYIISSPYFLQYAHREATGATIKNVSLKSMREFKVPLPSLTEQNTIVSKLDNLSKETQRLESIYQQKLSALEALKKSVLDQAFTGHL
jgi:type I restriction enzyme S subunit